MKTVGSYLKEARLKKRFSLSKVEDETKIKKEFIESLENNDWQTLPDFAVVLGFVKNIAKFLDLNEKQMAAILRRDYPPKDLSVNPKPDVVNKFIWSPKITFVVGISLVLLLVFSYLGYQYKKFVSPPSLEITEPKEGEVVRSRNVWVLGKTDQDVVLKVNNQPVLVEDEGQFKAEIQIYEGTTEIVVKAVSRSGKETTLKRTIRPEL
jgi:cytoskeletal protein RodZ